MTTAADNPRRPPDGDRQPAQRVPNALTVDVEDWVQSVFDPTAALTDWFIHNTRRVLEHLAERDVRATFFVLGLAARKAPNLVREIQAAGHEIQSHGYAHRPIHHMTPAQFREDVLQAKHILEDTIGRSVTGYRAPAFSITLGTLWALDVLAECGYEYDSSIFPVRMRRYGIRGAARFAHRIPTRDGRTLLELPVACARVLGRTWPMGGGGYFRLLPYSFIRRGIDRINRAGQSAVIYMHPYEYNPQELRSLPVRVPAGLFVHQYLGRSGFRNKLDRLLSEFAFTTMSEVAASLPSVPLRAYRSRMGVETSAKVYRRIAGAAALQS